MNLANSSKFSKLSSESLYLFCVVSLSLMKISDTGIHGASSTSGNAVSSFPPCIRSFKTTKNVSSWLPSLSFLDLVEWEQMQWLKRRLFWRQCSSWRDTLSSAGRILYKKLSHHLHLWCILTRPLQNSSNKVSTVIMQQLGDNVLSFDNVGMGTLNSFITNESHCCIKSVIRSVRWYPCAYPILVIIL